MPRGDRTGPRGLGKLTGRGAGYCAGNNIAGFEEGRNFGHGYGRGFGHGYGNRGGFGYGFRGGFGRGFQMNEPINAEAQKTILETEIKRLQEELDILNSNNKEN